ncbi:MFS transporter [Streptomyces spiralis]|uniref:MFS transporter n=1 Tax=Streptomyces spiralis TaxID=66376 RepID=UPI00369B15E1
MIAVVPAAPRVIATDLPLSAKPDSREQALPHRRSHPTVLARLPATGIPLIERGRGDLALERIERSWTTWRGRAVKPLLRASLEFARQAVRAKPLTVHADGTQRRCFLHVADAVAALLLLLDHPGSEGDTFNIGADEEISIRELADRIISQAGSVSRVEHVSYADTYGPGFEDMERRVPDTTKLRALTGWRPQHSLSDVIDAAIADARAERPGDVTTPAPGTPEQRLPVACEQAAEPRRRDDDRQHSGCGSRSSGDGPAFRTAVDGVAEALRPEPGHHQPPWTEQLVSAAIMVGALLGSVFGGYFVDRLGRFKVFMADMVFFVVAAIGCAVAPDVWTLTIARFLMGIGIGIDFPVAFSFLAEYAARNKKRGRVSLWQPMWYLAVSSTFALLVPVYFLFRQLDWSEGHMWRVVVGFGAVPALVIMVFRQKYMAESPSWAAQNLGLHEAARILEKTYGIKADVAPDAVDHRTENQAHPRSLVETWGTLLSRTYRARTVLALVINAAQAMQYYAVGFFVGQIVLALLHTQNVMPNIVSSLVVNICFGATGGFLGARLSGRVGPRKLSLLGFCGTLACMLIAGSMSDVSGIWSIVGAVVIGLLIFCHAAGPGAQDMTMATMSYPTSLRGAGTGFSQIGVRVGAIAGLFFWPVATAAYGTRALLLLAAVPALAVLIILAVKWDPTGRDIDAEDYAPAPAPNVTT